MAEKGLPLAVRINSDIPNLAKVKMKTALGNEANYQLLSIPFYLINQLHRLLDELYGK